MNIKLNDFRNKKFGSEIFSSYDATIVAGDIALGKIAYGNSGRIIGTAGPLVEELGIRSFSTNYGNSSTASLTLPGDIEHGDLVLLFIGSNYGVSNVPGGFLELYKPDLGWHNVCFSRKIAEESDSNLLISAPLRGSEPWNMAAVIIKGGGFHAYSGNRAESGTSIYAWSLPVSPEDLIIVFGSARIGSTTLGGTPNYNTTINLRNSDISLSQGLWYGVAEIEGTTSIYISSPSATQGMGIITVSISPR